VSPVCGQNYAKTYNTLDSSYYCFRRLNQTHQIGCASKCQFCCSFVCHQAVCFPGSNNGNYGIVKLIRDNHQDEDLQFISQIGSDPPYVAVITAKQLANM